MKNPNGKVARRKRVGESKVKVLRWLLWREGVVSVTVRLGQE